MRKKRSVCISFLGNAYNDTRVTNLTNSLKADGLDVKVISFDWTTPDFHPISGDISVYKLVKKNSSLSFYLSFAKTLFKELLKTNSSIYIAADIYTLRIVTFIAKLRRAKIYYNSREFYAFIAGLRNKKFAQSIIRVLEKFFIKKTDLVLVTGEMDAKFLQDFYGINNTLVIRNLPVNKKPDEIIDLKKKLNIPEENLILLYQGVILEGRGFEPILNTMKEVENIHLVVLGEGEQKQNYIQLSEQLGVNNRVHFLGTIPQDNLINYTAGADIGLVLIENISKSYYYALPNKLFEYIMAGLPVISSNLPQMKNIVENYEVGEIVELEKENDLTETITNLLTNKEKLKMYRENTQKAADDLNWQKEYEKVKHILIG